MSNFFLYNGKTCKEGTGIISPDNRGLRYGDGLFETFKIINGRIELADYHFDRLFSGMKILQFEVPEYFTPGYIATTVAELCTKNKHTTVARARLMIFRGSGGLYDAKNHLPNFLLQTWNLDSSGELDSIGLILDFYSDAKKACDIFSNLKSNNFLPYVMAALFAQQKNINDCIVLNSSNRICDTTIANIFVIKDQVIVTPPLSEGCVAGVMRRFVLQKLMASNFNIEQKALSVNDIKNADEVFLTNSISPIRWVKQFGDIIYENKLVKEIKALINNELIKESCIT